MEDFSKLHPSEVEIFVVRPVKKIVSILSHVVSQRKSIISDVGILNRSKDQEYAKI